MKNKSSNKLTLLGIQRNIFKLYILILPIMLLTPFEFIKNFIGSITISNNLIIHLVGLLLLIIQLVFNKKITIDKNILLLLYFVIYLNFSTLIVSLVLNNTLGTLHGESVFSATSGLIVLYLHVFLIFFYNQHCFKIITIKELEKLINIIIIYTLIIGYFQILIITIPATSKAYDFINLFGFYRDSDFILAISRISLNTLEPAATAQVLSILIIPYLMGKYLYTLKAKALIIILLFMPIAFFTKSSTVYTLIITNILVFLYFLIKKKSSAKEKTLTILFLLITIGLTSTSLQQESSNEIKYLTLEKASDTTNASSLYRTSTVINDIEVFKKYPIFGIGNGNQGFYYSENITDPSFFISEEVSRASAGEFGIVNGGPFIPAFISGYGIVGSLLFIFLIKKLINRMKKIKANISYFYEMYFIGSIAFLVSATLSNDIIGNYLAIFVLSIPFLIKENHINQKINY